MADTDRNDPNTFIRGYQAEGGMWAPTTTHRGRAGSWVAVALMIGGFALAGVSLVLGPAWGLLIAGAVLMAIGGIVSLTTDIFTDVVLDDPRRETEEKHSTPLHRIKRHQRVRRAEEPAPESAESAGTSGAEGTADAAKTTRTAAERRPGAGGR
ncbi:hypothetical protein ACFO4E_09355 [Nocardiopsis mangrovi]|uniref:Uncharacterized protein n=1 Tax=Nocardiopsis mangrovi TaxID=1179818 RepID=A0ABV9DTI5_9ACTN